MLGRDLTAQFSARHEVTPLPRSEVDITDPARVMRAIDEGRPDVVIHAAAFTGVDQCEIEPTVAFRVNADGTRHVALACKRLRIPMLYISTDYVFDGEKPDPYVESDAPNPINVYGKSKLEGERIVAELVERFWVVRASWLFGPLGRNFVKAVQSQAEAGRPLRVVSDQIGAPTYTTDLADKLEEVVTCAGPGVYHITNQGWCSWFAFAQEILVQAGLAKVPIAAIPTSALDRPARRPKNSRLANVRLEASSLGLLPPWQDALHRYFLREKTL
jgi:dTDP-4-dehydrorhamnose reductase